MCQIYGFNGFNGFNGKNRKYIRCIIIFHARMSSNSSPKFSYNRFFFYQFKAFGMVSVNNLLNKLEHIGKRSFINNWFESYLYFSTLFVCSNIEISGSGCFTIRVPQGSILFTYFFVNSHKSRATKLQIS